jgi:hypothetical protein
LVAHVVHALAQCVYVLVCGEEPEEGHTDDGVVVDAAVVVLGI